MSLYITNDDCWQTSPKLCGECHCIFSRKVPLPRNPSNLLSLLQQPLNLLIFIGNNVARDENALATLATEKVAKRFLLSKASGENRKRKYIRCCPIGESFCPRKRLSDEHPGIPPQMHTGLFCVWAGFLLMT